MQLEPTLDDRCRQYGISMLRLARMSRVPYNRIYGAQVLRSDEVDRIEGVFDVLKHRTRIRIAV